VTTREACDAALYVQGSSYDEEPIEYRCERPAGHLPPHRNREPSTEHFMATAHEWWSETWWDVDA